ncbi:MAG: DUF1624 domain-containing protein, partial [Steroidobacteraceae bacterium]
MSARIDTVAPSLSVTSAAVAAPTRLSSIDALRGLVMVLMALDHARDFFTDARFDPLDLSQTTLALFLTRWVTHLCAPTFIFLAGVSAYLLSLRITPAELSRFLVTRGLWLILLEVTIVQFAWTFNFRYDSGVFLQVIWAIGVSMIVLAALARLPIATVATISLVLIAGHNLFDGVAVNELGAWAPLWSVLHVQGQVSHVWVLYPLIPWVGVMGLGFAMGAMFQLEPAPRRRLLIRLGVACLSAFILLRAANAYGDPQPWSIQPDTLRTLLSFMTVQKYPPSLSYLLVMLGSGFLLLAAFESARGKLANVLRTFGRVPLFFYVLHIAFAQFAAGVVAVAMGFGTAV